MSRQRNSFSVSRNNSNRFSLSAEAVEGIPCPCCGSSIYAGVQQDDVVVIQWLPSSRYLIRHSNPLLKEGDSQSEGKKKCFPRV